MKKNNKLLTFLRYFILFAIIGVAVFFLGKFFKERKTVTYIPPIKAVTVVKPEKQTLEKTLTFPGYIESVTMVPVVPFVNGTILEYPIKAGDFVKKDTVLALIDPEVYRLQVMQADAAYLGYYSAFSRIESLFNAGSTTQQNYDTAKAQADAAKAQLDLANLQLSYTEVKAPIDGTVISALSAKGSIGSTQSPIAVLADLDNLIVNLEIPEKYYTIFSENTDKLKLTISRQNQYESENVTSLGTIDSISPYIKADSKSFTIRIKLNDNIKSFKPGMYVKINIAYQQHEDVYTLPQRVKKSDGSIYYLDEELRAQTITFDELFETNEAFEIPEEYKNNTFILTGQNTILSGEKVQLKEGSK